MGLLEKAQQRKKILDKEERTVENILEKKEELINEKISAYEGVKTKSEKGAQEVYEEEPLASTKICNQDSIPRYEPERVVEIPRKSGTKRKKHNRKIAITSIVVLLLLIGGGIGGYIWYNWDSDGDGVRDEDDAFPDDSAASVDTDSDGWPDKWNKGKTEKDSTSQPKLHLDAFPNDPGASIDTDSDGYPDEWNEGGTESDSETGLYLDAFPNDPSASIDTDSDGWPDEWNEGKLPEDSTSKPKLHLDDFPNDPSASFDRDSDGYPDSWNLRRTAEDSTTGITHIDRIPNDPAASIDTDSDGWPDEWNEGKNQSNSTTGLNRLDDFPDDPAASLDSDIDGYPDEWNPDKDQRNSTTGISHIDALPNDPNEWNDTDDDGIGDNTDLDIDGDGVNNNIDDFPFDLAASADSDSDGYPDMWNKGKTEIDSTTGLHLDVFPNDENEWMDTDSDGVGDNGDAFPNNPTVWVDLNGNGIDDNFEDIIEEIINGTLFRFVFIPSGSFLMGSPEGEGDDDEHPQHQVTISKGFQMLKFEITQKQWWWVMESSPSYFSGDENPVEGVSWNGCQSFISKLNELDSKHTYRLPTEAEWEYSCRAGSDTEYYFGDDKNQLGDYAWYSENSNDKTHPVGKKTPNTWGLYDMHGNVWEWCQDDWHDNYNSGPNDGSAWGDGSGSDRVIRGCSWYNDADFCRSNYRYCIFPDYGYNDVGLRLVRVQS